jgi:hypothetical protein
MKRSAILARLRDAAEGPVQPLPSWVPSGEGRAPGLRLLGAELQDLVRDWRTRGAHDWEIEVVLTEGVASLERRRYRLKLSPEEQGRRDRRERRG